MDFIFIFLVYFVSCGMDFFKKLLKNTCRNKKKTYLCIAVPKGRLTKRARMVELVDTQA